VIRAFIFDLDGTLVQTEIMKAESYARAAVELSNSVEFNDVISTFKKLAGFSRKEVAEEIVESFDLKKEALARADNYKVRKAWKVLVSIRMDIYNSMISNPENIREHLCIYNFGLLKWARNHKYLTGLATQSEFSQSKVILEILDIESDFDCISTMDDIENPKPDPEIYNLISSRMGLSASECLVIEDSPAGIQSALNAGMGCIAVPNSFTREAVHKLGALDEKWIVDSPRELMKVAQNFLSERSELSDDLILE